MKKVIAFMPIAGFFIAHTQVSVVTQHNNNLRTGWNNKETSLNTKNVNVNQFGKIFTVTTDDQIYAQPLVATKINIESKVQNILIIATVNNSVYAVNADSATPVWNKNYTPASQRPVRNADMTGACHGDYRDFSNNIGIVSTPVIDSVTQTLYFVARSTDGNGQFYQYLHAVDIKNGNEVLNSPVLITGSVAGSGDGSVNGILSFDPLHENQRQALSLYNNTIYIGFGSHCDWKPYNGWVMGYDALTLQQKYIYCTTPAGGKAGIWQSGGGASIDENGNVYVVTGNGSVGTASNPSDVINRGESAVKLTPQGSALTVSDFFTAKNFTALEDSNLDYGSMGAFLVPNSSVYFTGGKDGNLYLLNKNNLGGYDSASNHVLQTISLGEGITLRCQPAYCKIDGNEFIYLWSETSQLKALPFNGSSNFVDTNNIITGASTLGRGTGAGISTSSDNNVDSSGIVWANHFITFGTLPSVRPGILQAFDARDITKELWNSNQNAPRDSVGFASKFTSPTIANGKVYLATFSNKLIAYGLIDPTGICALPAKIVASDIGQTAIAGQACFTAPGQYTIKGSGTGQPNADAVNYMYTKFTGNGKMQVYVSAQDESNSSNKAGIMFRESLQPGAKTVFLALSSGSGAVLQYRNTTNGANNYINTGAFKAPYYLKLVKVNNRFKAYISPDKIQWFFITDIKVKMNNSQDGLYAGLAVTSNDNTKLSTAVFQQLIITLDTSSENRLAKNIKNQSVVQTQKMGAALKVFPNPANKNFIINFSIAKKQNIVLAITGIGDGRIYYQQSLLNFSGVYNKNFVQLPAGTYLVTLKTKGGTQTTTLLKE